MAKREELKTLPDQVKDVVLDVRNEAVVQSANLYLMARKALMASLGAAAISIEEANAFVEKLAERGELVEADLQKWAADLKGRAGEASKESGRTSSASSTRANASSIAGKALEESIEVILNRLNVPTQSDIEALSRKISALNQKVSALMEQREKK